MDTVADLKRIFALVLVFCALTCFAQKSLPKDICDFLGGRSDKNFLGSGNVALVVEPSKARLLFVQQWKEKGVADWLSGSVKSWNPDRIALRETVPAIGASISEAPVSRTVFITRDDVVGMELVWKNESSESLNIRASFSGTLPGNVDSDASSVFLNATSEYSNRVPTPLHYMFSSSIAPALVGLKNSDYSIDFSINLAPHETKSLVLLLGIGLEKAIVERSLARWRNAVNVTKTVRDDWNAWFDQEIPQFSCSDPYFEKLYYYRWWSLYTKMIFAKVGHFYYPSPREGTVMYEGVVSYSGACVSVDELRWMRNPDWAFSTAKEFFAPENLNDGYLSNHIWDWGIDGDESNMDSTGRSVPYQNYAVDAFRGALLVHPENDNKTLKQIWPQIKTNLESYPRFFDVDKDGLYETYPWSNSAGQEWQARFSYFDPIPEMMRNERGRTYAPDGSRAEEDMQLLSKIRNSVVTDPSLHWPETSDELYRVYYANQDHRLATVDQTSYAYRNFVSATELAKIMSDSPSQKRYANFATVSKNRMLSQMWNSGEHFFYDVTPENLKQAKVKATTGFYPFWARIAQKRHVPMLAYVFDPNAFWTKYPLPSLPLNYEKYDALQQSGWNYWNFATWPRTTCHVVDGVLWSAKNLDRSLSKNAAELFNRYTRVHFAQQDVQKPNIAERYDPGTGNPFLENLDYNHSSWIDLLFQHVAGITPDDSGILTIDPIDMSWQAFSVKKIRYRDHDIDIDFNRRTGVTVRVDGQVKARSKTLKRIEIRL